MSRKDFIGIFNVGTISEKKRKIVIKSIKKMKSFKHVYTKKNFFSVLDNRTEDFLIELLLCEVGTVLFLFGKIL